MFRVVLPSCDSQESLGNRLARPHRGMAHIDLVRVNG